MSGNKKILLLSFTTALAIVLIVAGAWAQESSSDQEFTLETLTVTAEKRLEDQQKVPIPMDVFSGSQMSKLGETDVDDIISNLSTVNINYQNDGMRVELRGLGSDRATRDDFPEESPMVAINVDGVFNALSNAGQNMFDIQRIEVLYGPQSTLYASNSPGGIVNVITNSPILDEFGASVSLEGGNYSLFASQFMLNVPILDNKFGIRLSGQTNKKDSYLDVNPNFSDPGTTLLDEDTKNVRLKTLYQPTEDFSAEVTVLYSDKINSGRSSHYAQPFDKDDGYWLEEEYRGGPWVPTIPLENAWTVQGEGVQGWVNGPNKGDETTKSFSGHISWSTKIGDLSAVAHFTETDSNDQSTEAWTDINFRGPPWLAPVIGSYGAWTRVDQEQKGFEAHLTSKEDSFITWIVGVNWFKLHREKEFTYSEIDPLPGYEDLVATQSVYDDVFHPLVWVHEEIKAIFANATIPITDSFRGSLGIRYSEDTVMNFGGPTERYEEVEPYKEPDYKVGFEYDLTEDNMLYAHYATSYRINYISLYMPPEENQSYTVGIKNMFFDRRLMLNASAYYYDYENVYINADGLTTGGDYPIMESELVTHDGDPVDLDLDGIYGEDEPLMALWWDPGPPGISDLWDLSQYGSFTTTGVDISADWLISQDDRLHLSISYLDSEWEDCTVDAWWKSSSGGPFWPGDGQTHNGKTRTKSPKWTIGTTYQHTFHLGSYGTLVPRVDIKYRSSYNTSLFESYAVLGYQESHFLINGNLTYTSSSGRWSMAAYVRNATDYPVKVGGGYGYLTLNAPRTYGLVLTARY